MTTIEWKSIPETYWPDTAKPWRVTWGLGAFEDFRTKKEAQAFSSKLRREEPNDWAAHVSNPFNAAETVAR